MTKRSLSLILILGAASTACSVTASIDSTSEEPVTIKIQNKPAAAEFVSGSTGAYQTTARGYKVQASVGHYLAEPVQETPTRHYKVYSSVQGSMLSE